MPMIMGSPLKSLVRDVIESDEIPVDIKVRTVYNIAN